MIINCRNRDCPENIPAEDGDYCTCGLDIKSCNPDGTCEHWLAVLEDRKLSRASFRLTQEEIQRDICSENYNQQMEHNREVNE
jgi:hypothetical protein